MIKIGITGNIGSGKSTVSKIIKDLGYKVFEADKEVKKLLEGEGLIKKIEEEFSPKIPGILKGNKINKNKLGGFVFSDPNELRKLENIIHPKIWEKKEKFFKENLKERMVFLDIPLLFEKKLQNKFNYIIYTYVSRIIQKKRVLDRKNMNEEKFNRIIANQNRLSDYQKSQISLKLNTDEEIVQIKKKIINFLMKTPV